MGWMIGFAMPSVGEWPIVLVFGLLLFARRLPAVGRGIGSGIFEIKRALKNIL